MNNELTSRISRRALALKCELYIEKSGADGMTSVIVGNGERYLGVDIETKMLDCDAIFYHFEMMIEYICQKINGH